MRDRLRLAIDPLCVWRTDGGPEDGSVDDGGGVASEDGTEGGGDTPDDQRRVVDDEAVGPRLVARPPDQHAADGVRYADDGDEEDGLLAPDAGAKGEVGKVDERDEETCNRRGVITVAVYRDLRACTHTRRHAHARTRKRTQTLGTSGMCELRTSHLFMFMLFFDSMWRGCRISQQQ